jgi:hypothetical protein
VLIGAFALKKFLRFLEFAQWMDKANNMAKCWFSGK